MTIISLDIEAMYPSIKFKHVQQAVEFFSGGLSIAEKRTINECLQLIRFGMENTLLTFQDQYYVYDGDRSLDEKGLTIGGYESAWLADLVAAYILEHVEENFSETSFYGMYRDDGFVVFNSKKTKTQIQTWLNNFQLTVDELCDNSFLQFKAVMWQSDGRASRATANLSVDTNQSFPYLDMEMYWSGRGGLRFRVHLKPNQQLLYLNRGSSHTSPCYRAIKSGVLGRLAKLTSATAANLGRPMHQLYPEHTKALQQAGLSGPVLPTMKQVLDRSRSTNRNRRKSASSRSVFFCIGYSKFWKTPIHVLLRRLRNKYNLRWLRVSMSYHRFSNLRELFQGHLNKVLLENVVSIDYCDRPCNCQTQVCRYGNDCRKQLVVYKVKCEETDKFYIGATSDTLKNRVSQHLQDARTLLRVGERSSTLASHLAARWQRNNNPSIPAAGQLREKLSFSVLWQGDPFSCSKKFGQLGCKLCQKERVALLRHSWSDGANMMNLLSELNGACRHKPRFHRLRMKTEGTDDSD